VCREGGEGSEGRGERELVEGGGNLQQTK